MENQLLNGPCRFLLWSPGFEFIVVSQEQFGQITGILSVVLGAAGDEGLSVFLEGERIDRIKGDPFIGFEVSDEMGGRLFQAEGDPALWVFLPQLE